MKLNVKLNKYFWYWQFACFVVVVGGTLIFNSVAVGASMVGILFVGWIMGTWEEANSGR